MVALRRLVGGGASREDDEAFVRRAYVAVLGREADGPGLAAQLAALRAGTPREEIVLALAESDEHRAQLVVDDPSSVRRPGNAALEDLTALRPDRYRAGTDALGRSILTYEPAGPEDFDWIEAQILRCGYYEEPGVWSLAVDTDKRLLAELAGALHPTNVLEIGCSSGAVLAGLAARGAEVTGIELSSNARDAAPPELRERILLGDPLTVEVSGPFDQVLGLDVFEHLNPNRIDAYLRRCADLLGDGGWLVANIPAFGTDPTFGDVFGDYLGDAPDGMYTRLHVDDRGYPLHGHLVWALWSWWQERFEAAGLRRCPAVEAALLERYGAHFRAHTPARGSLFVFRKGPPGADEAALVAEIRATPSSVLASGA